MMKKIILFLLIISPIFAFAQKGAATIGGGGAADGVSTSGTWDDPNNEIDMVVASPGSNFSIDLQAIMDSISAGGGGGSFLPLAGGTMTGNILFNADNTIDLGASGATV